MVYSLASLGLVVKVFCEKLATHFKLCHCGDKTKHKDGCSRVEFKEMEDIGMRGKME